jgi:D-3-phosphoglycerate dehydrogenase
MRSDAIFVNTARSAVVDTQALWEVLSEKKIRGAVLDVFDGEPPTDLDSKIIQLPHVLATPHIAGATEEVKDHHSRKINKAIFDWWEDQS